MKVGDIVCIGKEALIEVTNINDRTISGYDIIWKHSFLCESYMVIRLKLTKYLINLLGFENVANNENIMVFKKDNIYLVVDPDIVDSYVENNKIFANTLDELQEAYEEMTGEKLSLDNVTREDWKFLLHNNLK